MPDPHLIPRTPDNDELAHMLAELQEQIKKLAPPPPPPPPDLSGFVREGDRRLENARRPLRHGEAAHQGYIGDEVQVKFDISNGHDHDGVDSKLISHTLLGDIGTKTHSEIDTHIASAANPHAVTAAQAAAVATADHTKALHDALGIDADTLDGSHAAAFAIAAKGVTNGDSHDHSGGDGAQIDHGGLGGLADDDHTQYLNLTKTGQTLTENLSVSSGKTVDGIDLSALLVRFANIGKAQSNFQTPLAIRHEVYGRYQYPANDGDRLQMYFVADGTERYFLISTIKLPVMGTWDLYVNGVLDSSGYDDYAATQAYAHRTITLAQPIVAGANTIELRVNGKHASSTGYYVQVEGASIQ